MSRNSEYDHHITVFSPEGRLYQIEYALNLVSDAGLPVVALRNESEIVVATHIPVREKYVRHNLITNVFRVYGSVYCALTGRQPDFVSMLSTIRRLAAEYADEFGCPITVDVLARRLSDYVQVYTQQADLRPLAVAVVLFGKDGDASQLYLCQLSGSYSSHKALLIGAKSDELQPDFEKLALTAKTKPSMIDCAVKALRLKLGRSLESNEIEIVTLDEELYKLNEEEVQEYLVEEE